MKNARPIIIILLILIIVFAGLIGRCFYLQYAGSGYRRQAFLKQQQARIYEKPRRGLVLDCRGRILAASNLIQTVFIEPRVVRDVKETASKLAEIIDIPAHKICKYITESKNPGYVKIKVGIRQDQRQAIGKARIQGVGIQSRWERHYPIGQLTSHIVGFAGVDDIGLNGIELKYDKQLRGDAGENIFFADAARRPIGLRRQQSVRNGNNLVLTIDSTIQQFVRSELARQFENYEAESAVGIAMDPRTGAVLALVSLPDFEPQDIGSSEPQALRNRALTDPFEPGSILKPIAAAIAIDSGAVGLEEKIFCEYGNYHGKGFGKIGEYGDHRFGDLTVREILVYSSNIGMAKIGQKMGKDKLYKGLKLFGFGKKTGIDLPGENSGILWPVKNWTGYSTTRIPFGQEISVTAMQIARAFSILANGGRLIQPYLVKAMVDNSGKVIKLKQPPSSAGLVIKSQVARWIVTQAMTGVVNEGTGKKAALERWQVFGKTGTANIAKSGAKGYDENAYVASFIAGAPAENPKVVVLVSIRKPKRELGKGYTGGTVAAPVVREILKKTLNYLEGLQQI